MRALAFGCVMMTRVSAINCLMGDNIDLRKHYHLTCERELVGKWRKSLLVISVKTFILVRSGAEGKTKSEKVRKKQIRTEEKIPKKGSEQESD